MSWSDNGGLNVDGFRLVCETAIGRMGPQEAKRVFKEALAEFDRAELLRLEADVLWTNRVYVGVRGAYERAAA